MSKLLKYIAAINFIYIFLSINIIAQQVNISGKIVDEDNRPLVGAVINVRGGSMDQTAMSDKNGNFNLFVKNKAEAIVDITLLGYYPVETKITTNSLYIKMREEALSIEETVVVAYGAMSKKDLTGAVAMADINEMKKAPVFTFGEALAGRVAGVSVSAIDAQPGTELKMVIRGANSITQDNSPLYIVDGFPIEDFKTSSINPEDIKTFNILKDASATALYGARGANGVIVIETKGGFNGKPEINYGMNIGFSKVANKMDMMTPYEFVKYQTELFPSSAYASYFSDGRTLDYYKSEKGIDWQSEIFREVYVHNYNASIRGGNETTKYTVSGQLSYQPGVILNTGADKYSLRSVLEQKIGKNATITLNLNGNYNKTYGQIVASGDGGTTSSYLLYRTWGFRPVAGRSDLNLLAEITDPENISNADIRLNPVITSNNDYTRNANKSLVGNLGFRYVILKGLQIKAVGSLRYNQEKRSIFYNSKTTQGSPLNPTNTIGVNGSVRYTDFFTWNAETTLSYDKVFNQKHRIGLMGGTSLQERVFGQFGYSGYKLDEFEQLGMSGLDNGLIDRPIAQESEYSMASIFGRFNYSYKSKYLFTLTLRADGSSKFPNHKWGFFPSAALSWNMAEEEFIKNIGWLSTAKLRASYGATGNNRVGDYDAYSSLVVPIGSSYSYGNSDPVRGLVPGSMGNMDLKWETTYQADLGLDLSILDDRVSLVADIYHKDTRDLLLLTDSPRTSGYPSIMKNIGRVQNRGLELTLNTVNISSKDFEWTSNFNISFNQNKVIQLDERQQMLTTVGFYTAYKASPLYMAKVGMPLGLFYGYVFDGVYQYENFDSPSPGIFVLKPEIASNASNSERNLIQPGDIKYKDLNGDGQVDDNDMTVIGNGNPIFIGGFANTLRYKGLDLSFLFQWSYGNDIYNANRLLFDGNSMGNKDINQYATYNNRWTPDNPSNVYYRTGGEGPSGRHSSRVLENGSYLRLKTLSIGYSIPKFILSWVSVRDLRFSLSTNNLLTFTKYSGMDPEVSTRGNSPLTPGFDYSAYPVARTLVLGVQMTF